MVLSLIAVLESLQTATLFTAMTHCIWFTGSMLWKLATPFAGPFSCLIFKPSPAALEVVESCKASVIADAHFCAVSCL